MLSIGKFSRICGVSPKTLRYYAEIDLMQPNERNQKNGYRYYSIDQLEDMLFINRLKSYDFSLEDIKKIIKARGQKEDHLYVELCRKKEELHQQLQTYQTIVEQLEKDIENLRQGIPVLSYMEAIDIQLVEVETMQLLSIRHMVMEEDLPNAYKECFRSLFQKVERETLTILAPPMVLFHSAEFSYTGMDIEFAIPIKEYVTGTRDFHPGLCLKTVLHGDYSLLPSIYAKQCIWAQQHGYENQDALFEIYVNDPSSVASMDDMITEIYYPIYKNTST